MSNPRHLSESTEHYTPAYVVEAARAVLGTIDLDPATSPFANQLVRATHIFTAEDDGYVLPWFGSVFLNPPGGKSDDKQRPVKDKCVETGACGLPPGHTHEGVESSQKKWWFKLARELQEGRVQRAIFVCFSVELLQTTQVDTPIVNVSRSGFESLTIPLDWPICYPSRRVPYDRQNASGVRQKGASPPHASCIIYCGPFVGPAADRFKAAFSPLGRVVVPTL